MKIFIEKLERFISSNTSWIFLVLLLFFSYLLLLSVLKDSFANYLGTFLKLCLIFSPVLLFAFFRASLLARFTITQTSILWLICFLIYPVFIYFNGLYFFEFLIQDDQLAFEQQDKVTLAQNFLLTSSGAVLLTEIVLLLNKYVTEKRGMISRIQNISFDRLLLGVLIFLALVFALIGVVRVSRNAMDSGMMFYLTLAVKFVWFTLQFILINLIYYFYYFVNKQFLIPKIFKKRGVIYYGFSVVAAILVFYPVFIFLARALPVTSELGLLIFNSNEKIFASDGGGFAFLIMVLTVPVIVSNEWFTQSNQIVQLEKEKSQTELNLLKQQINPHFFFNTLNNLYALSITKDEATPEVIMQLSELMRYVIYKGKEEFVLLKEEIKYIEDYVRLQQIRLHKRLDFKFSMEVEDEHVQIPPLLFVTFVENAFKHGIEPAEHACFLHLKLVSNSNALTFVCKNSIEAIENQDKGIGLNNLKRRLELRFPKQHELHAEQQQSTYIAQLMIKQG